VEAIDVPASVQALLAARVDRLASADKELLQAAAVIGKDVRVGLLRQIADLTEQELQSRLASLQAGEFLYETHSFPEPEYTFKHVLTQEVVYAGLLKERRQALHARIVEAIEQLYADRLPEHVAQLAHHAVQAEQWSKAVTFLRHACLRAFERSMYRAAVAAWDEALRCLEHLPQEGLVAHCHLGLGKLYGRTGKRELAQEHLTSATTMYREMGMTYWVEQAGSEIRGAE